ncbi:PPOX class F420-dependent oxidoreductase [Actinomycetospora endophytica]|uniref:PPOX class F420-dependent oxidoreductase n=1 Tax=Actinomycetospora endophytica TaxID=2291215 RepID=A0ABS8PAR1_9PSEU|nr:PPOX class F420-dependent oxidoreductase [Actinomycetospora endophytica]MCD2194516.1 PPOX class F420-dependent oxidoreductase [Actinomycetospora endophytica]
MTASLVTLGDERFVSLTTYRRTGEPVATPVWVVRDGDALVASTVRETGKITRIRHDDHVELRACDRRGRVHPGTPSVIATAVVDESPDAVRLTERLLRIKYGWEYVAGRLLRQLQRRLGRPTQTSTRVVLRLTPM